MLYIYSCVKLSSFFLIVQKIISIFFQMKCFFLSVRFIFTLLIAIEAGNRELYIRHLNPDIMQS